MRKDKQKLKCCALAAVLTCISAVSHASLKNGIMEPLPFSFKTSAIVTKADISADQLLTKNADAHLIKGFSNIQLGIIPDPLGELVITREEIKRQLGDAANIVKIPETVTVKRNGAILRGKDIADRIVAFCNPENAPAISVDLSKVPGNIILPGNLIDWQIDADGDSELGMRLLTLSGTTDGGSFRQMLQVNVSKTVEVAVLKKLVKPGEVITESMVVPQAMSLKNEYANNPVLYSDVIGQTLSSFKSAGTVIRPSDLASDSIKSRRKAIYTTVAKQQHKSEVKPKKDYLVSPGESVEFVINTGNLSVRLPAKALQGGDIGDSITLLNVRNKKRIEGVIIDKGVVEYAKK